MTKLEKKTVSQYFRTQCDKFLLFSLCRKDNTLPNGDVLPSPIKARPQIAQTMAEGRKLERSKYDLLSKCFPTKTFRVDQKSNQLPPKESKAVDFLRQNKLEPRSFLIETPVNTSHLEAFFYNNLGISEEQTKIMPSLADFRPDILRVLSPNELFDSEKHCQNEVHVDGTTSPISLDDGRTRLAVIDVKNSEHGNPSYAAEVVLYTLVLSNWIHFNKLHDEYVVTDQCALWVRGTITNQVEYDDSSIKKLNEDERIAKIDDELAEVPFEQFLITLKRFLLKDIPRVTSINDWRNLDWHIEPSCSMCDWLAYEPWLKPEHKELVGCNHCHLKSEQTDHLSKMAFMTKGMRRTLEDSNVPSCQALSAVEPESGIFNGHASLKKERSFLPVRASAFKEGLSLNTDRVSTEIPNFSNCSIYVVVNFDASTGTLASIATTSSWLEPREYQSEPSPSSPPKNKKRWPRQAYIVTENSPAEEFEALKGFLLKLKSIFEFVNDESYYSEPGQAKECTTHIYFWEERQYEFLTKLIGRYLWRIIVDKSFKGLSWLFPPEELNKHPNLAKIPVVSFVKDCLKQMVALPVPYSYTLINVAQAFLPEDQHKYFQVNEYYSDPFSDAIPKERIYEIWNKNESPHYKEVQDRLNKTMCIFVNALESITVQLRSSVKKRLKRNAAPIKLLDPKRYNKMAPDSRLWMAFAEVCASIEDIETRKSYFDSADELEAAYKSVRVIEEITDNHTVMSTLQQWGLDVNKNRIFKITEDSMNSKIREGDSFLTIIPDNYPGFPEYKLGRIFKGKIPLNLSEEHFIFGSAKVVTHLKVKLSKIDRINGLIAIQYTAKVDELIKAFNDIGLNFSSSFSLISTSSDSLTKKLKACLGDIGNPAIAIPDEQGILAQGIVTKLKPGKSKASPASRFLWDAEFLTDSETRSDQSLIENTLKILLEENNWTLEPTQRQAIFNSVARQLSVIWGPPGTGKTDVAKYSIALEVLLSIIEGSSKRILITGPTYRACHVLVTRLLPLLDRFTEKGKVEFNLIASDYSGGIWNELFEKQESYKNLCIRVYGGKQCLNDGSTTEELAQNLLSNIGSSISITVATPQSVHKIKDTLSSGSLVEIFDYIAVDECSQVDVANAILVLASLSSNGSLSIFGDHLQMPPIHASTAPKGAEYLVGSYQEYLIKRFGIEPIMLDVNFRSNEDIVRFGHQIGYKDSLTAKFKVKDLVINPSYFTSQSNTHNSLFYSNILDPIKRVLAITYPDGKSAQANEYEATMVAQIIYEAWQNIGNKLTINEVTQYHKPSIKEFWTKTIGIVTPHKAHKSLVFRKLLAFFPDHDQALIADAIDTVERFQGGERDIILVAFGVGDPAIIEAEEEFLLQLNRTNVAISRAISKSIMVISEELVHHLPDDLDVVKTSKAIKNYVYQYCNNTTTLEPEINNETREVTINWKGKAH